MNFDVKFTEQTQPIEGVFGDKVVVVAGGGAKEEWIDIADITTTEETTLLILTEDIENKPFECKSLAIDMILPSNLEGTAMDILFRTNVLEQGMSMSAGEGRICVFLENINNKFMTLEKNTHALSYWLANRSGGKDIRYFTNDDRTIKWVHFGRYNTDVLPIGTQIKIWGLKA